MAKLERYNSFEEMDEALLKEQKAAYKSAKPNKVNLLKLFAELLKNNTVIQPARSKKS